MSLEISDLKRWFSENHQTILDDFFRFLQFKSISTDPHHFNDSKQCAQWLAEYLKDIGLETEIWQTSGQPVIFAKHCLAGENRPTLMIYHHYDVQPVDPLELWKSDPFTPTIREGNVYARGAQDNKGQCFYTLTAIKALFQLCDSFNFNLKLFIEGEEESGSRGTREVFEKHAEELKSDHLLIVDSGIPKPDVPAIALGVRGIITAEVICRGADHDLHSGSFGGIAYNPIRALATVLSTLWDDSGRVAIAHFYDEVKELTLEELKNFEIEIDEEEMKKKFGLRAFCPDPGYSIGQSASIRPTLEINGINGGYTGLGYKTVLPAVAIAKISCRLVPHQDPDKIFASLKEHLIKKMPKGLEVEVISTSGSAAFHSSGDSLIAKLTSKAYEEVLKKPCKNILMGGSIPMTVDLAKVSRAETVIIGYGLDTDEIHAPNEHFGLDRFEQGFLTIARIFNKLTNLP